MNIEQRQFLEVVDRTPLVSIDLVIRNEKGQVLLGYRLNRPAQHAWFVPGGRIRKNEPLQEALHRIARNEVGIAPGPGRLIGAFDHLYPDNFAGEPGVSTHYVVLGYEFALPAGAALTMDDQHSALRWWDVDALLASDEVHANSKLYFRESPGNGLRVGA
ncbi:colanic acid biosynthesis protein WcaH [Noviherbaspirillum humi]|uniref:Colanic acid biosynthesis protein WcaH n=1 Tax=Noviherbaspirillum humi TaxID=1688639 RepID=A0A239HN93_9BURK|nr:GDP-mannose mannosyl hydrolase [Noviherbaspirillum humi]SNS82792.1 colanic acid biosynthesis protein WcaH [Noviherbaspirillum humi]